LTTGTPNTIWGETASLGTQTRINVDQGTPYFTAAYTLQFWYYAINNNMNGVFITLANTYYTSMNVLFTPTTITTATIQCSITIMTTSAITMSPSPAYVSVPGISINKWNFFSCAMNLNNKFTDNNDNNLVMTAGGTPIGTKITTSVLTTNKPTTATYLSFPNIKYILLKNLAIYNYFRNASKSLLYSRNVPKNSFIYNLTFWHGLPMHGLAMHMPMNSIAGLGTYDNSDLLDTDTLNNYSTNNMAIRHMFASTCEYCTADVSTNILMRYQVDKIDHDDKDFTLCYDDMVYNYANNTCMNVRYAEYLQNVVTTASTLTGLSISISPTNATIIKKEIMESGSFTISFYAKFSSSAITNLNGIELQFGNFVSVGINVIDSSTLRHYIFFGFTKTGNMYQKAYYDVSTISIQGTWVYYFVTTNHFQNIIYLTKYFYKFGLLGNYYDPSTFNLDSVKMKSKVFNNIDFIFIKELKFFSKFDNSMYLSSSYTSVRNQNYFLYIPFDMYQWEITTGSYVPDYSPYDHLVSINSGSLSTNYNTSELANDKRFPHCGLNEYWLDTCTGKHFI
jgi:hypothetical protein